MMSDPCKIPPPRGPLIPPLSCLRRQAGGGRVTGSHRMGGNIMSYTLYNPTPIAKPVPTPVPPPTPPVPVVPPIPTPVPAPVWPPKPRPNMIQYTRLMEAYQADQELPTLTTSEYATLISEVNQHPEISEFDKTEMLDMGRFFGRGFAVDYNKE